MFSVEYFDISGDPLKISRSRTLRVKITLQIYLLEEIFYGTQVPMKCPIGGLNMSNQFFLQNVSNIQYETFLGQTFFSKINFGEN